jgi:hypothetical protein
MLLIPKINTKTLEDLSLILPLSKNKGLVTDNANIALS